MTTLNNTYEGFLQSMTNAYHILEKTSMVRLNADFIWRFYRYLPGTCLKNRNQVTESFFLKLKALKYRKPKSKFGRSQGVEGAVVPPADRFPPKCFFF